MPRTRQALRDITLEVELGYDREMAFKEAERCLNCDVQTVFSASLCIECDACVDICPVDCITFTADGEEAELRTRLKAPAQNLTQDLYVQDGLKTGRVMVKDEDVCLHCGMCAERCPTGAWDMQKFLLEAAKATTEGCTHAQRNNARRTTSSSNSPMSTAPARPAPTSCSPSRSCAWASPSPSRNIFPSNIQGLPTWFEVRVSGDGHLGRRGGVDLMVAMNPQTWDRDIAEIEPGGYLFYDITQPLPAVPLPRRHQRHRRAADRSSATPPITDARQRQLLKNIIYVGALSALLDIEPPVVEQLLAEQFKGKEKLAKPNLDAFHMGRDWALKNLDCPLGLTLATVRRGRRPHLSSRATPPPRSARSMAAPRSAPGIRSRPPPRWPRPSSATASSFRTEPETGKKRYAIVQAEDEIASIGIVIGAGWNGARAFTATSGPGISLMQEFVGLAYFAEIPAVIFDVQRAGPCTGMPTRTQQSDLLAPPMPAMATPSM